jgi:hypothetical protein
MDDNFRMPEWIAYHYYMMNLRYLVVHPDPRSKTSPAPVLDKWRDRIAIVEWTHSSNFSNYTYELDPRFVASLIVNNESEQIIEEKTKDFFKRQVDFYQACAFHLRSRNRTWTSFHDNDEFLVVASQADASDRDAVRRGEPGVVWNIFQRYSSSSRDSSNNNDSAPSNDAASSSSATVSRVPVVLETQAALDVRDENFQLSNDNWDMWFSALPCVVLPRALFGAVPTSSEGEVMRDVPGYLDARRFDTLNWRYQGTDQKGGDGPGKAFVDVSRLPLDALEYAKVPGIHRPFGEWCTHAFPRGDTLPLSVHHYLGSWEAFSYRDDVRKGGQRSIAKWRDQSVMQEGGLNDDARPWIAGFAKMVGDDAAKELLRDAGLPRDFKKSENETGWEFIVGERDWTGAPLSR